MPYVYEQLAEQLVLLGVDTLFGLVGSGNFCITEALRLRGVRFVASRHEAGALAAADSWARLTNRVGVCTVHMGPGFTNALTPLVEAAKSRTPIIVLAAEISRGAVYSNFAVDQAALAAAAGAIVERLHTPTSALEDLRRAWRRAWLERRPVVLLMPQDIQTSPTEDAQLLPMSIPSTASRPDSETISRLLEFIEQSQRPLILAGRGAVISGAKHELVRLGDVIGALFATTANAHGLFADNPWNLGIAGGFAAPGAVDLMRQADLILTFGASLTAWTHRHGTLFNPTATVISVDTDPAAIGARYPVTFGCVADARATAAALVEALQNYPPRQGWRTAGIEGQLAHTTWKAFPFEDKSTADSIDPRTLSRELDALLPEDRVLVTDSGHFMAFPIMYIRVPDERGFVFTQAFQSIGLGLPTAIGAAIASPSRITIAAVGDGGLLMALSELETVARLRLPIIIIVYNDSAYAAEVHHFRPMGFDTEIVTFPDVDFAALGQALDIQSYTIRSLDDLATLASALTNHDQYPILIDAKVNPQVRGGEWFDLAFQGH